MKRLLYDWSELNNVQEIEIIKEYADFGRYITLTTTCKQYLEYFFCIWKSITLIQILIITVFIYVLNFCFILILFLSNFLLDITSNKNESRPRQFPILMECFLDQQKYFFPILLAVCLCVMCAFTTVIATETLAMSYTQHACGLFEIAR